MIWMTRQDNDGDGNGDDGDDVDDVDDADDGDDDGDDGAADDGGNEWDLEPYSEFQRMTRRGGQERCI